MLFNTAFRSGHPWSSMTTVIRWPFAQWPCSPRKILRTSESVSFVTGFDRLTIMARGWFCSPLVCERVGAELPTPAQTTRSPAEAAINRTIRSANELMVVSSEGKRELRGQHVCRRQAAPLQEIILELECHRVAGVESQPCRGAAAKSDVREDGLIDRRVDVLVAEVRPVRAEPF